MYPAIGEIGGGGLGQIVVAQHIGIGFHPDLAHLAGADLITRGIHDPDVNTHGRPTAGSQQFRFAFKRPTVVTG